MPINILTLRAAAYLALGQRKDARSTYADILKQDPTSALARRQLRGLADRSRRLRKCAVNVITAGIAASPRNYQLYQDYVTVDLKATGIDAALASADRLTARGPGLRRTQGAEGRRLPDGQPPADAVTAYAEAGKTAPSSLLTTRLAGGFAAGRAEGRGQRGAHGLARQAPRRHDRRGTGGRGRHRRQSACRCRRAISSRC